ncbi:TPA: hypothetical protein MO343_004403 [Salmonella enterica subsp. enterica serovar Ball]|nr:hypothetical protein [Salmonella enterica subsp. enterica serovar Ball]
MARRKNKPQRTQIKNRTSVKKQEKPFYKKINSLLLWLAAIGILPIISNYFLDFFTGDVQVNYIQPSGRGYEFKFVNNSSTDQIIKQFRISPEFGKKFIFKINKSVYAEVTDNGVTLPGGNSTYMPAFEYKEMNGYVLKAKSEVNFRIPPLVARDYMIPESIVVYADYSTESKNRFMAGIENIFEFIKIRDIKKRKKYLVVDNYWTPLGRENEVDAIKNACRDDDIFAKSEICKIQ